MLARDWLFESRAKVARSQVEAIRERARGFSQKDATMTSGF
jgi:hypothetical protein